MNFSQFKKNSIHNILGWIIPIIIFIILTPIMIKKMGQEAFGIITIIQIITGYMTVLNFGFSEAIIKQVAESFGKDKEQTMRVLWVGMGIFFIVGSFGTGILFLLSGWLGMEVLQVPEELRLDTVKAIQIGSIAFLLQMMAEFYRGASLGCHRFDIPNISRIVRISLSGLFIVLVLEKGMGIVEVMIASVTGLAIGLVINVIWMHKILPMNRVHGGHRKVARTLFHFSKHIFFVRLAGIVSNKIGQFFLGTLSSIANVALYEVPTRAAEAGSTMLGRVLQVFYPGISAMDKVKEKNKIKEILLSVLSIQMFISIPIMIMVVLEGATILSIWIDPDFAEKSAEIIMLVAITYLLSSLTNLPGLLAMSFDIPSIISKYSVIRIIITAIIVYPFVKWFGLIGAAWVLLLSELPGIPFIHETVYRIFGIKIYRLFARKISVHIISALILYVIYEYGFRNTEFYTPYAVLLIGVLHAVISLVFKTTTSEDNRRMMKVITVWKS